MKAKAIALIIVIAANARAQTAVPDSAKQKSIQDNSFLVEEAYNQEAGVVQHINALNIDPTGKSYEYDFTQEWPVGGITHQLSYTLPLVHSDISPKSTGIGDVLLNYRYQLVGDGDAVVAVSPRFSVALPTGDWKKGAGSGAAGYEALVPVSVVISNLFVTHWDAGMRHTPSARNSAGDRAGITKYTLAASGILLLMPTLNLMLETIWSREDAVVGKGEVVTGNSWAISPGIRGAFNFQSKLQIVPGIGFPIGVGPSRGNHGVFLYLSFEHPFNSEGRGEKK
jgi:hypothetical protein